MGKFAPHHKTPGGHRCYTEEQVEQFLNGDISFEKEEKPKTEPLDPIVMSVMKQLDDTEKNAFKTYIAELEKKNVKVAEVIEGMNDAVRLAFVGASIEPYKS